MTKFVLKKKFADFMGLETNTPYGVDFIKSSIINKHLSVDDIKTFIPRFKSCSCKQSTCQNNSMTFYNFVLNNYMEENNFPTCNFYYDPKQQPKELNFELISFD